jgi:myo-inositol-1-phosphate synthase
MWQCITCGTYDFYAMQDAENNNSKKTMKFIKIKNKNKNKSNKIK